MEIPTITKQDLDAFVATHEFNEVTDKGWFWLNPYKGEYHSRPGHWFNNRVFTPEQVLIIAVGLGDGQFEVRQRQTTPANGQT